MQALTAEAAVVNVENDPYDYFKLFFTDRFLETLVIETKRNASQYLTSITFLGLILLTGIMDKKGKIADYWRTKPSSQMPFFN